MDAVFHIRASEFDENLFSQIQSFLKERTNAEITITINEEQPENSAGKKKYGRIF